MLAFASALAGCPEFLPIDIDSQGVNVTTYLLGAGGKPGSVVVVNRDRLQHARLSLTALGMGTLYALRLLAATPDSTTGVTFGGASVGSEGRWTAKSEERIRDGVVTVPRMSAVVLRSVHWPARASN
jgi:hypothetical protein